MIKQEFFYWLVVGLFAMPSFLMAQNGEKTNYFINKHEISISGLNLGDNETVVYHYYPWIYPWINYYTGPILFNLYPSYPYTVRTDNRLYGLNYKYHFAKSAFRVGLAFNNSNNHTSTPNSIYPGNPNTTDYLLSRYRVNLGYEVDKNFTRTRLFLGFDIYYDRKDEINKTESFNQDSYYPDPDDTSVYLLVKVNYKNRNENITNIYGINPLLGIEYFLTPNLSLSAEARFIIEINKSKNTNMDYNDHPNHGRYDLTSSSQKGFTTQIAPLSYLSVNIHF